jgi:polyphosphate kinase 2 (PPK2 family)
MSSQPSIKDVHARTVVDPKDKKAFVLKDRPTRGDQLFESKKDAKSSLDADALVINELQDAMFASKCGSLLVVMQGIDTAGKDGTTKECFKYTSPLGVHVHAFGKPTEIELAHDYLWRIHAVAPRKGHITVFNRSQYEDVLVVKVRNLAPPKQVEKRYEQINQFEKSLTENGTHPQADVSKEEQGRLQERLEVPANSSCGTSIGMRMRQSSALLDSGPWHVIPSDGRSRRDAIAARLIRNALEEISRNTRPRLSAGTVSDRLTGRGVDCPYLKWGMAVFAVVGI